MKNNELIFSRWLVSLDSNAIIKPTTTYYLYLDSANCSAEQMDVTEGERKIYWITDIVFGVRKSGFLHDMTPYFP